MADVTLKITAKDGSVFQFSDTEIPSHIPFGGEQILGTHTLVGGVRQVDAFGRSDAPIQWSGLFRGATASERGQYLDHLRVLGQDVTVTYGSFSYSCKIESFVAQFQRFYLVPYRIRLVIIKDNTKPVTIPLNPSVDQTIKGDLSSAKGFALSSGDSTLNTALSTLDSAISKVSSFAKATTSTINSVLTPIKAVTDRVDALISSTSNTIASVTTVGGILPNNPISQQAAKLTNQVTAQTQSADLYNLRSVMARMHTNVSSANNGNTPKTVTVNGGSLYQIAADQYGDATKWSLIAQANGLSDPVITGEHTLTIPPQ